MRGYFLSEGHTTEHIDQWNITIIGVRFTNRTVRVRPRGNLPTILMTLIGLDDLPIVVLMTDRQNCCGLRGQPAQLVTNTQAVCDNLKAEGVTVYAVAFEAPANGG